MPRSYRCCVPLWVPPRIRIIINKNRVFRGDNIYMWRKALIAATVAGMALPGRAAEPEAEPEKPKDEADPRPDAKPDGSSREVLVIYGTESEGLKAPNQTSGGKIPLSVRET